MSFAGQEKAVLTVFRGASHFNFLFFSVFSYTSQHEKDCRKTIFLYAGWRTHLLRFHGERPYHARVESQVVVSLEASEFFLTLESWCILIHGS